MKFLSWILSLIVLALALCFALNNQQSVTVSLWPFGVEVVTPVYILSLGTLFLGFLLGAVTGWLTHLPHRIEARRLRRDIADLRDRVEELAPHTDEAVMLPAKSKWRFWDKKS